MWRPGVEPATCCLQVLTTTLPSHSKSRRQSKEVNKRTRRVCGWWRWVASCWWISNSISCSGAISIGEATCRRWRWRHRGNVLRLQWIHSHCRLLMTRRRSIHHCQQAALINKPQNVDLSLLCFFHDHHQCFQVRQNSLIGTGGTNSWHSLSPFWRSFSRWTWVSRYQNVSIPGFIGAKDDGGGEWWHWSYKMCTAKTQSKCHHQQANIQFFLQTRCLSCRPTNSVKALKGSHGKIRQLNKFWVCVCVCVRMCASIRTRQIVHRCAALVNLITNVPTSPPRALATSTIYIYKDLNDKITSVNIFTNAHCTYWLCEKTFKFI